MGATVLFIMIILPIICSVAFASMLVIGHKNLAKSECACEHASESVYVSSPAVLA